MLSTRLLRRPVICDELSLFIFGEDPVVVDVIDDLVRNFDFSVFFIELFESLFFIELGQDRWFFGLSFTFFSGAFFFAVLFTVFLSLLFLVLVVGVDLILVVFVELFASV